MSEHPLRYERAATLMEAELGDELVALDPARGQCFGFNSVATAVWQLLEQPRSAVEIEAELMRSYVVEEAQCREEVAELLVDLQARGLIRGV